MNGADRPLASTACGGVLVRELLRTSRARNDSNARAESELNASNVNLAIRCYTLSISQGPRFDWFIFPRIDGGLMAKKAKKAKKATKAKKTATKKAKKKK
ncbi:hypothetical protein [Bradyrhizobium sp. NAS80.1]|uniref:hypothetical protein n=1 Tax=Bradyrhizobium sp. NAS80.1 TaxID=1680159 RepID=UPI00116142BB|nr:hypothetical protein [Bradyrhizobium sp. NAS80.1]